MGSDDPSTPHRNLYIQGRIRAALAHVRTVLADDTAAPATAAAARAGTPEPTLAILRRAAGVDEAAVQTGAMQDAQTKGQEKNGSLSLSLWLSLPPEPWSLPDKAAAATPAAAAGAAGAGVSAEKRMDAVPWLYRPPNDLEWKVMTNPMYMATTVKFHRPSPNGR